jgi:Fe2+ or Zn2+ uptake regulation protein
MGPHHHFSCRSCGALMDFESPEYDSLALPTAGVVEIATFKCSV